MRHITWAFFGCLIASTPFALACSGKKSQAQPAPVPLNQAPAAMVNALCDGFGSCCASKGFAFNATACNTNLGAQVAIGSLCPAPGIYDPQAAADCFAELQAGYASCSPNFDLMSACQRMCTGTQPPGGVCTSSTDCAVPANGSVSCATDQTSDAGHCIDYIQTRGKAGDPCNGTCTESADGTSQTCIGSVSVSTGTSTSTSTSSSTTVTQASCFTNDGFYCAADSTCEPAVAVGGACSNSETCQTGAYCNLTTEKCEADIAVGVACPMGSQCVDSAYCNASSVCANKKSAGEPCTSSEECLGNCDATTNQCEDSNTLVASASSCANPNPK